jgi:hypothetical protein
MQIAVDSRQRPNPLVVDEMEAAPLVYIYSRMVYKISFTPTQMYTASQPAVQQQQHSK